MIKLSVVVVTRNNPKELKHTLDSLFFQNYKKSVEIIIVNGGAKITYNLKKLKFKLKIINDSANGIYGAMNLGLTHAIGKHVLFLNSGDELFEINSLKNTLRMNLDEKKGYYMICNVVGIHEKWNIPSKINKISNQTFVPVHQSILFNKTFYKKYKYNVHYKIAADYEYKIKFFNKQKIKFIPYVFSKHFLGGVSSTYSWKNYFIISKELFIIDLKYKNVLTLITNQTNLLIKFFLYQTNKILFMENLIKKKYQYNNYEFNL
jgi:glycosyltransferase involved in cell wall biosynthesis